MKKLFLSILILNTFSIYAQEPKITVIFEGQNKTASIQTIQRDGILYVPADKLFQSLNLPVTINESKKKVVVRAGTKSIKFTSINPFVVVDEMVYQMPVSTIDKAGAIYVPLAIFFNIFKSIMPEPILYKPETYEIFVQRMSHNIMGVDVEDRANGAIVHLITNKDFKVADVSTYIRREWLNVTVLGGKIDTVAMKSDHPIGLIRQIAPFQFEKSSQLSLRLDRKVKNPTVYVKPGEILISLRSSAAIDPSFLNGDSTNKKQWLIDKIILDPGHGGRDPGAIGINKLKESHINLDIAKHLKRLIQERLRIEVLMTRNDDKFVEVKERPQMANAQNGKLFISIHANTNSKKSIRGVSTYVLGNRRSEEALAVAEKENSVIELEENTEEYEKNAVHILNAVAQSLYLKESEDFAQMVNERIVQKTKIPDAGVHQGGFYVLMGAAMPRILIETAFLSNSKDARLLRSNSFRRNVAEAIFESIKLFKDKYEQDIKN